MKRIRYYIIILICFLAISSNSQTYFENQVLESFDPNSWPTFGFAVSLTDSFAIVGAPAGYNNNGVGAGAAYIFKLNNGYWEDFEKLCASDGDDDDAFGFAVDINGDYSIIGAYWDDENGNGSGSAYIFHYDNGHWTEQIKLLANDGEESHQFGFSVSISDSFAVVGARGFDDNSGAVYVFENNDGEWNQVEKYTTPDTVTSHYFFGFSTGIEGNHFVVGSLSNLACIYNYDGSIWQIDTTFTEASSYFGRKVSISDSSVIISSQVAASIYSKSGNTWIQEAELPSINTDFNFEDVSIHKNTVIVSAYSYYTGIAYVYERIDGSWEHVAQLNINSYINPWTWRLAVSNHNNFFVLGTDYWGGKAFIYDSENFLTSIENIQNTKFDIYPNPAINSFYIKTNQDINSIQIFSMTGVLVKNYQEINENNSILINGLKPGIYIVRLSGKQAVYDKKLVVIND